MYGDIEVTCSSLFCFDFHCSRFMTMQGNISALLIKVVYTMNKCITRYLSGHGTTVLPRPWKTDKYNPDRPPLKIKQKTRSNVFYNIFWNCCLTIPCLEQFYWPHLPPNFAFKQEIPNKGIVVVSYVLETCMAV